MDKLIEKCVPSIEVFEDVEKQVFFPIPAPGEFSATIRIYASTMCRRTLAQAIPIIREAVAGEIKRELEKLYPYSIVEQNAFSWNDYWEKRV